MRFTFGVLLLLGVIAISGATTPLQTVYQNATPNLGYDRYVVLDDSVTYTGGIAIMDERVAIIGNGALINLNGDSIVVQGNSQIDLQQCVIINGKSGVCMFDNVLATVSNCTFYGNQIGIRFDSILGHIIVYNTILANNHIGYATLHGVSDHLTYIDAYQNSGGNYLELCPA